MLIHKNGTLGKSRFLSDVDAEKAVLDAAEYADKYNLWETNTGNPNDFKTLLAVLKGINIEHKINWDEGAGEGWAFLW